MFDRDNSSINLDHMVVNKSGSSKLNKSSNISETNIIVNKNKDY